MENYKLAQSVSRFKEIADELSNLYKDKNTILWIFLNSHQMF